MLTKTHIRRPLALSLVVLGALVLLLAPQTWPGVVLLGVGIGIELVGISLKR